MVFTSKGKMANFVSRFLPQSKIVSITDNKNTYNALALVWGVTPIYQNSFNDHFIFEQATEIAKSYNLVKPNDNVLVVTGTTDIHSNIIKIAKF